MKRNHTWLCKTIGFDAKKSISDPQLRRLLSLFNQIEYNEFNASFFGWEKEKEANTDWYAFDGKELRGTIDGVSGQKRGLCIVRATHHETKISYPSNFYHGDKESEIPAVRALLSQIDIHGKGFTMDAMHCQVETLVPIQGADGTFLVQVKDNQKELAEDLKYHARAHEYFDISETLDKGHGRIELREAKLYDLTDALVDKRWKDCQLTTLVVMKRDTINTKKKTETTETSFYISNEIEPKAEIMIKNIRTHWGIESDNYVRDVTFREDKIRCSNIERAKSLASITLTAVNLIQANKGERSLKVFCEDVLHSPDQILKLFNIKTEVFL